MYSYQHHIGDFLRDTSNLSDHQLATYLRLLWTYYDTEKPIQGHCDRIAFAVRSDEKTVQLILEHYFKKEADGWVHSRCEKEITAYKAKSEKAKTNANARWKNADAMRPHTERIASATVFNANREPRTENREPSVKPKGVIRKKLADPLHVDWLTILQEHGVDLQTASDFLTVRKAKRAAMTKTALDGLMLEAEKAGITLNAALKVSTGSGWSGFKASWYENAQGVTHGQRGFVSKQAQIEAHNDAVVRRVQEQIRAQAANDEDTVEMAQ